MSSLAPAGGTAPSTESVVDRAVARIIRSLYRRGIHLPSVRDDLVTTRDSYAVNLGSALVGTVTAPAEPLDRTAVTMPRRRPAVADPPPACQPPDEQGRGAR